MIVEANIDAEVNRCIGNPGQALAYGLGELKILALRHKAKATLGAKFDVRRFHDVVLGQGAVPLDTLDAQGCLERAGTGQTRLMRRNPGSSCGGRPAASRSK